MSNKTTIILVNETKRLADRYVRNRSSKSVIRDKYMFTFPRRLNSLTNGVSVTT